VVGSKLQQTSSRNIKNTLFNNQEVTLPSRKCSQGHCYWCNWPLFL